MRKIVWSMTAVAVIGGTAMAGGEIAAVDPEPADSWSGFYAGLQAGYSRSKDVRFHGFDGTAHHYVEGFDIDSSAYGLFFGYNHLFENDILVGIEGEWNSIDADDTVDNVRMIFPGFTVNVEQNWEASLRLRLGMVLGDFLPYVTGGPAWSCAEVNTVWINGPWMQKQVAILFGWTVGAGVEMKISENLHGRIQYRYSDYGTVKFFSAHALRRGPAVENFKTHMMTAGISYRFPAGGGLARPSAAGSFSVSGSWSGFYAGLQAGYSRSKDVRFHGFDRTAHHHYAEGFDIDSSAYGLFFGYNHLFENDILVGIEGEWNSIDADDTVDNVRMVAPGFTVNVEQNWEAAARLRLGMVRGDFLPYVTGGIAWSNVEVNTYENGGTVPRLRKAEATLSGWTVGTGIEMEITQNLHGRIQYRYSDYGDVKFLSSGRSQEGPATENFKSHMMTVGVSYRF
jgi:outer membrane immunogenic protein